MIATMNSTVRFFFFYKTSCDPVRRTGNDKLQLQTDTIKNDYYSEKEKKLISYT